MYLINMEKMKPSLIYVLLLVLTAEITTQTDTSEKELEQNEQTEIKEKGVNLNVKDVENLKEEVNPDGVPERSHNKKETGTSFSFGRFLKDFVDPMFAETDKTSIHEILESKIEPTTVNETIENNNTLENTQTEQELNTTDKRMKFKCISRNLTIENTTSTVQIINNTRLLQILNFEQNDTLSDCVLVMFYAPWCRFCAKVAPNYNALARVFPDLDVVAVDAAHFSNLNARFGTVSVPNILLFHQSRAVVRFNQTDKQFENLVSFVKNHTGMEPDVTANVMENDYDGPLPSVPSDETDNLLWLSWLFVIIFISVMFVRSSVGQLYINKVKILWQEHQHIE